MARPVSKYSEPARRYELEERLRNLKMREGEAVRDFYYNQFVPVYEELAATGRQLDDEARVFMLLNALPTSWSGFVEVIVLLGLDTLSVDDLYSKIMYEEETGDLRADNRKAIKNLKLDTYMQLRDVRLSVSRKNKQKTRKIEEM